MDVAFFRSFFGANAKITPAGMQHTPLFPSSYFPPYDTHRTYHSVRRIQQRDARRRRRALKRPGRRRVRCQQDQGMSETLSVRHTRLADHS